MQNEANEIINCIWSQSIDEEIWCLNIILWLSTRIVYTVLKNNNTYFAFPIGKGYRRELSQIQALFLTPSLFAAICSWIKKGSTTIIISTFQIPFTFRVHVTVTLSIATWLFLAAAFFENKVLFFSIDQPGWKIGGITIRVTRSYQNNDKGKLDE